VELVAAQLVNAVAVSDAINPASNFEERFMFMGWL
jgi:hypothetical protein